MSIPFSLTLPREVVFELVSNYLDKQVFGSEVPPATVTSLEFFDDDDLEIVGVLQSEEEIAANG